jgi:hypothetical protein
VTIDDALAEDKFGAWSSMAYITGGYSLGEGKEHEGVSEAPGQA